MAFTKMVKTALKKKNKTKQTKKKKKHLSKDHTFTPYQRMIPFKNLAHRKKNMILANGDYHSQKNNIQIHGTLISKLQLINIKAGRMRTFFFLTSFYNE